MAEYKIIEDEPAAPEKPAEQGSTDEKEKSKELILGRFNSPDELAKAYKELEGTFTQDRQKMSEYERRIQELEAQRQEPPKVQEPAEDEDELFWKSPAKASRQVFQQVLSQLVNPLYEDRYDTQKERFRSDPDFAKVEPLMDQIVRQQPNLMKERGGVERAYKAAKAVVFDPSEVERRIREKVMQEIQEKGMSALESSTGSPPVTGVGNKVVLDDEMKKVALKFYSDAPTPEKAYELYAAAVAKKVKGEY